MTENVLHLTHYTPCSKNEKKTKKNRKKTYKSLQRHAAFSFTPKLCCHTVDRPYLVKYKTLLFSAAWNCAEIVVHSRTQQKIKTVEFHAAHLFAV